MDASELDDGPDPRDAHGQAGREHAGDEQLLIASNRGPVSFTRTADGRLEPRRGAGGLVSGLAGVAASTHVVWVCAALSDADREAARQAPQGRLGQPDGPQPNPSTVRMLDIPPATFQRAYNGIANSMLWFVHHLLYDLPHTPHFDGRSRRDWQSYEAYNAAFADAVGQDAARGAKVAVQDYHLSLAPRMLRERRPDLKIAHVTHTPWAPPEYYRLLPEDLGAAVLEGILGADYAGFMADRWAEAFLDCCAAVLDAKVDRLARTVTHASRVTRVGVHGLGVDGAQLRRRAAELDVTERARALRERVGDGRRLIVRVDRTDLTKNIVRGLCAYRELLANHREWHGRVVHLAFAYPSRGDLKEYREYMAEVRRLADQINEEFGNDVWSPVLLQVEDDYARSLAAYSLADVLLVNPIRDGMNLVAKEGPVLSRDGCALVLSRETGAAGELGEHALLVNPYDVSQTAEALHQALLMPPDERSARCAGLTAAATALPPQRWFADQVAALG